MLRHMWFRTETLLLTADRWEMLRKMQQAQSIAKWKPDGSIKNQCGMITIIEDQIQFTFFPWAFCICSFSVLSGVLNASTVFHQSATKWGEHANKYKQKCKTEFPTKMRIQMKIPYTQRLTISFEWQFERYILKLILS